MRHLLYSLAACTAALSLPLAAHAALKTEVFVEKTSVGVDGVAKTSRLPAGHVVPGDHLVYVITFTNDAPKPAEGVIITNPLPAGLVFEGSTEGPPPLVSADGATFASLPQLKVRAANGAMVAAQQTDVTHLSWSLPAAVPAGAQARLTYRATLK